MRESRCRYETLGLIHESQIPNTRVYSIPNPDYHLRIDPTMRTILIHPITRKVVRSL
jgi:hypothetical protein